MTDQPTPGTGPDSGAPWTPPPADSPETPVQPAAFGEPPTPDVEPAEPGSNAPAQSVARVSGPGAEAPVSRRSSGVRWAIALVGVAVVLGVTVAILLVAGGRPSPSVAVGYMPPETVTYAEYRFDLPGDQRTKMAGFLSKFPGFKDQSNVQTKLYEVFDRIVRAATKDAQSYTGDIDPWFGGQIAMGSPSIGQGGASSTTFSAMGGGAPLFVVTVKDQAKATAWLTKTLGDSVSESQTNGTTLYSVGGGFSIIVTDKVMLFGTDATVRTAFESKGEGKFADDPEFKAAFGTVSRDFVSFSYTEYRALIKGILSLSGPVAGLESTTVDDELLSMVPAWQASSFRFENDAIVGETAYPSIPIGYAAKNKKSSLIGHAPPGTLLYAESHDIGPALTAVLGRFRKLPELQDGFKQVDSAVGVVGGFDGLFGWWGDAAVTVSKNPDGSIGGGLLIEPTDAEAAKRTFATLRSFLLIAGSQSGIETRDIDHNGATITVVDFSSLAESIGSTLPPGVKAELAYTVTPEVVVIGYGEAFVTSVLDAGPGPSLADDGRVTELVKRTGEENLGTTFIDMVAIRDLVEPLIRDKAPADQWAVYEREIRPYLLPFDAVASGARNDGDLDRLTQVVTVK